MLPKHLYHWSKSSVDCFDGETTIFRVEAQGHAYTVAKLGNGRSTTSTIKAQSLLVFTGEAAELFEIHPPGGIFFWKRPHGQYWSRKFMRDITWTSADACRVGRVVVVKYAKSIRVGGFWRRFGLIARRAFPTITLILIILLGLDMAADKIFGESQIRNSIQPVADWFVEQIGFSGLTAIMGVTVIGLIALQFLGRVTHQQNSDGSVWDFETELAQALKKCEDKTELP